MLKKPVKEIPENYVCFWKFDLTRVRELFWLNFEAFVLFFFSILFFGFVIFLLRPEFIPTDYHYHPPSAAQGAIFLAKVFAAMIIMVPLHEGFHGLFFRLFSHARPKYAFKLYYAFASAPGWFFPRWQYFFISLAPLFGITTLAILGIRFLPEFFLIPLYFLLLLNTSGAVGDLWVVARLIFSPRSTMIRDFGDAIEFYMPLAEKPGPQIENQSDLSSKTNGKS
jgi:hypothetical protein